jgi:MFS family permease
MLVGQTMTTMDGSIVAVALPSIRATLHPSDAALQLVVAGYFLAFGMVVVTGARLGAELGHRRVWLIGLGGFVASSALCGAAPSPGVLVAARIVQGACGALMVPQVLSMIQLHFDGRARERAVGFYSFVLALGVAAGQIVGGLIVATGVLQDAWRPVFFVNVPLGAAALMLGRRWLPLGGDAQRAPVDVRGTVVLALAMAAILVPLVFGREAGWPAWTWPTLAAGLAGLWLFARVERGVERPLFDVAVLRTPGVAFGLMACCAVMGCYAAFFFVLALHLQDDLRFGALRAGLSFVPYACGFAALSLTWTRLPRAWHAWLPVLGPLALAGAVLGAAALGADSWPAVVAAVLMLGGAGHAAGYSPLVAQMSAVVSPRHVPELSGLVTIAVLLTSVLAIATLGGIYLGGAGLVTTCIAVAAVCLPGAGCAWWATSGERRGVAARSLADSV